MVVPQRLKEALLFSLLLLLLCVLFSLLLLALQFASFPFTPPPLLESPFFFLFFLAFLVNHSEAAQRLLFS